MIYYGATREYCKTRIYVTLAGVPVLNVFFIKLDAFADISR